MGVQSDTMGKTYTSEWLSQVICHLRDDLKLCAAPQELPQNQDICHWVAECYYPGLAELEWEEATRCVLIRMRGRNNQGSHRQTLFAELALSQLHRSTGAALLD